MSSSRSITAARNRRAGDPSPKIASQQPMRPVTSISSQAAFSNQPYAGNNIRVGGKQQVQQTNVREQKNANGLPFSKLTVSDAIGLVTLRLGRVEQFMIELQEQEGENGQKSGGLPDNTKLVDNSVLNNIINRLDSLEKKESLQLKDDKIVKIEKELDNLKLVLEALSKKIDLHEKNTNEKFIDYENAIVEIEKSLLPIENNNFQQGETENNQVLEQSNQVVEESNQVVQENNEN